MSMAQSKSEIYEFLNSKISEMHHTYSSKIELLSTFMMQAQDDIRDFKSEKNDHLLMVEDIKLELDQRDVPLKDQIKKNAKQVKSAAETMRKQSQCMLTVKSQLAELRDIVQELERNTLSISKYRDLEQQITDLKWHLHETLEERLNALSERQVSKDLDQEQAPAITEVVKQI